MQGKFCDNELVNENGFLRNKYHFPGDQILLNHGFTLFDKVEASCEVESILPAFTEGKYQLTAKKGEEFRQITLIKIHIEREFRMVKTD